MISYGVLECVTAETPAASLASVQLRAKGQDVACLGFNGLSCQLSTLDLDQPSYSNPIISSDTTITMTGTNLAMTGAIGCSVTYVGVKADDCVVDANGDAIATFNSFVPLPMAP